MLWLPLTRSIFLLLGRDSIALARGECVWPREKINCPEKEFIVKSALKGGDLKPKKLH